MRIQPVDTHRHRLALGFPVDVVERLDNVVARLFLFRRRHRVFQVEEDHVGCTVGGLFNHRRVRARHCQRGTLQALAAKRVKGMAHEIAAL
jgi:hypothetical protein